MSGLRVLRPKTRRTVCCDPFPSIDRIKHINSPTLIIHGDEVRLRARAWRLSRPRPAVFPSFFINNHPPNPPLSVHQDEIIHVSHGYELYGKCAVAVEPLFVPSAGHNDLELFPEFHDRCVFLWVPRAPQLPRSVFRIRSPRALHK